MSSVEEHVATLLQNDRETHGAVEALKQRADNTDSKADAVDDIVFGDGADTGLVSRVKLLEARVDTLWKIGYLWWRRGYNPWCRRCWVWHLRVIC